MHVRFSVCIYLIMLKPGSVVRPHMVFSVLFIHAFIRLFVFYSCLFVCLFFRIVSHASDRTNENQPYIKQKKRLNSNARFGLKTAGIQWFHL